MKLPPARAKRADILVHVGAPLVVAALALGAMMITIGSELFTVRSFSIFPSATADSISGTALTAANTVVSMEVRLERTRTLKSAAVEPAKGVIVTSAMTEPAFNTTETCSSLYPVGNPARTCF